MKVKELAAVIFDKVVIYEHVGDVEFHDIFKGEMSEIPRNILELEVGSIGAKRKGILDIRVKTER